MSYRIGVDIGTTSTKAVLYGENLEKIASANVGYRTYHDQPGFSEQEPMEIYHAFTQAVKEILAGSGEWKNDVSLISFSGAMHALILVDREGNPLTRSVIWSDNRSVKEVENFKLKEDFMKHYRNTGTPIHSMSPFFKLKWFSNHTELLRKTHKAIGIKEFIIQRLTGQYIVDYSIASATGMFNIHELKWDKSALEYLGISEELLSQPKDVISCLRMNNLSFLHETGLSDDVKIMIGASDGCLANLGSGAMKEGETTLTIGTSGAVRMTVKEPRLDAEGRTFCYYLKKDCFVIGGAVNNGGNILSWFDGIFYEGKGKVFEDLSMNITKIRRGSDGLLFIPYLHGERAPYWDGSLTASFFGMNAFHEKAHFVRAAVEGILFNLKEVLMRLETIGGATMKLTASGGFLKSEAWKRLLAEIFAMDIYTQDSEDSSCLGAVLLDDALAPLTDGNRQQTPVTYEENNSDMYQAYFERYLWYSGKIAKLQKEGRELFP